MAAPTAPQRTAVPPSIIEDRPQTGAADRSLIPPRMSQVASKLLLRVRNILASPGTEWPVIAAEVSSARAIYVCYVAPMAGIAVAATFLGEMIAGVAAPLPATTRLGAGLGHAVLSFGLSFLSVFVITLIVDGLAPSFGGRRDPLAALKVTAYSYTPAWAASLLNMVPLLGTLAIIAPFYGVYVLYLGLPVLMGPSKEQAVGYTVVTILCAIVIWIVTGSLGSLVIAGVDASG